MALEPYFVFVFLAGSCETLMRDKTSRWTCHQAHIVASAVQTLLVSVTISDAFEIFAYNKATTCLPLGPSKLSRLVSQAGIVPRYLSGMLLHYMNLRCAV